MSGSPDAPAASSPRSVGKRGKLRDPQAGEVYIAERRDEYRRVIHVGIEPSLKKGNRKRVCYSAGGNTNRWCYLKAFKRWMRNAALVTDQSAARSYGAGDLLADTGSRHG